MPKITPQRLSKAVGLGFQKQLGIRKSRLELLRQFSGRFYSPRGDDSGGFQNKNRSHPVNLIYQAATTMVPNLAYGDPKVEITTQWMDYRPYAETLALATNHLAREIKLRATLRMAITDAIFLVGWIKTGLGVSGQTLDLDGVLHDVGQPYADRVDSDDMTYDPMARTLEEAYFQGNRFRMPYNVLMESGLYDEGVAGAYRQHEEPRDIDAGSLFSEGFTREQDELMEYVDLVEVWVPKENAIYTFPFVRGGDSASQWLRVVDYEGPEQGPFHMLGFAFVPDNIMPVAPAMVWYDLHILANRLARKLARQAERQKSVLAYEASAYEDAADIIDADDGESVRVDHIDGIKEVSFGGATDDAYKFVDWCKEQFSEAAMNVDMLSGAGTNEPTATQAQIIQANTSVRLADMQKLTYIFTGSVMESLAFFLHTDPLIELPLVKRSHGTDQQVVYSPEMREGDWMDYYLKVIPYSMARQDPNLRVRRVLEFCANVIPALANAAMMLGPAFNLESAINLIGREMGIDELDEIINSPLLQQQLKRMEQLLAAGIPLDQKVMRSLLNPAMLSTSNAGPGALSQMGQNANMGVPGGVRPGEPNPSAGLRSGITPDTERNIGAQETAGELQATYLG